MFILAKDIKRHLALEVIAAYVDSKYAFGIISELRARARLLAIIAVLNFQLLHSTNDYLVKHILLPATKFAIL